MTRKKTAKTVEIPQVKDGENAGNSPRTDEVNLAHQPYKMIREFVPLSIVDEYLNLRSKDGWHLVWLIEQKVSQRDSANNLVYQSGYMIFWERPDLKLASENE